MGHGVLKVLSIVFVLCVLSVGGLAQAQSVGHAEHHAHHQAADHGTVLCSWMCAAGAMLDNTIVPVQVERVPVAFVRISHSASISTELCRTSPGRAPPSFSL